MLSAPPSQNGQIPSSRRAPAPPPWPLHRLPRRKARRVATLALAAMTVLAIFAISGVRFERQQPGYVGVVRNGGPLDDRAVRQVLLPGQRLTWTGLFSQAPHNYPSVRSLRQIRINSSMPADALSTPTRDGVQVNVEGVAYFRFVGESDLGLLQRFDLGVGTRPFGRFYAWENAEGFAAMADTVIRPVLINNLRREVGSFPCADLVASCSVVRPSRTGRDPNTTIESIQNHINDSLAADIANTLGARYFIGFRFRLSNIALPPNVQAAVDDAQAQSAGVRAARARASQARYEAQRAEILGGAYNASPSLARIDAIKAAPDGATVIIGGEERPNLLVGK